MIEVAEHVVYTGVLKTRGERSALVSLFREAGVRDDRPLPIRVEHWRSKHREMFLVRYGRTRSRFICAPKAIFEVDENKSTVELGLPEYGMASSEWGFMLPEAASPACYASAPPKWMRRRCAGEPGCREIIVQVNHAVTVGMVELQGGTFVIGPPFNARPGWNDRFAPYGPADPWPKSIEFADDMEGALASGSWQRVSHKTGVRADFDSKSYLKPSYRLTLRYKNVRMSPQMLVDHPDSWAVFRSENRKVDAYVAQTRRKIADGVGWLLPTISRRWTVGG